MPQEMHQLFAVAKVACAGDIDAKQDTSSARTADAAKDTGHALNADMHIAGHSLIEPQARAVSVRMTMPWSREPTRTNSMFWRLMLQY